MSEIPEDIRAAVVVALRYEGVSLEEALGRAILAERERCAALAKPIPLDADASDHEKHAHDVRSVIYAAIRHPQQGDVK